MLIDFKAGTLIMEYQLWQSLRRHWKCSQMPDHWGWPVWPWRPSGRHGARKHRKRVHSRRAFVKQRADKALNALPTGAQSKWPPRKKLLSQRWVRFMVRVSHTAIVSCHHGRPLDKDSAVINVPAAEYMETRAASVLAHHTRPMGWWIGGQVINSNHGGSSWDGTLAVWVHLLDRCA